MKKINIGLIGFGYWGPNYARILSSIDTVNLKWISDLENNLLIKAKNNFPEIRVTQNFQEILDDADVDAVIVATPASTHAQIVAGALTAGKHVLVEKPLTIKTTQAKQLTNLASKKKVKLFVGHTYLYNPAINYLKNEINKGNLGNILYFVAQRMNLGPIRSDVNAMWDLATHDVSTILYLLNAKPVSVIATGSGYLNKNHEDIVNITIIFENDVFANILVSWLAPIKIRNLTIVGDKKMAVFDEINTDYKIRIIDKTITQMRKGETIPFQEFKMLSLSHGKTVIPQIPSKEPLIEEVLSFVNMIVSRKQPIIPSTHAYDVVRILDASQRSLRQQRKVKLNTK